MFMVTNLSRHPDEHQVTEAPHLYDVCVTLPCGTRPASVTDFIPISWTQVIRGQDGKRKILRILCPCGLLIIVCLFVALWLVIWGCKYFHGVHVYPECQGCWMPFSWMALVHNILRVLQPHPVVAPNVVLITRTSVFMDMPTQCHFGCWCWITYWVNTWLYYFQQRVVSL